MLQITPTIAIEDDEIEEQFIRSPGPGGQKINKTESAVQLRFDARHSPALDDAVFLRLTTLAGRRMTKDGVIVLTANRYRTQERNRADAQKRLVTLIRDAIEPPKFRRPTRPSKAARQKRLEGKLKRAVLKRGRGRIGADD